MPQRKEQALVADAGRPMQRPRRSGGGKAAGIPRVGFPGEPAPLASQPSQTDPTHAHAPRALAARGHHEQLLPAARGAGPTDRRPIVETEATILLADIRGFTALMEAHPPRLMARVLNRFLAAMCAAVDRYEGHIDKFIGDSVMAVFGVPQRRPDDLRRALACAAAMQQAMVRLNQGHRQRGEPALYAGIAVHTGAVMAGSFGPPRHNAYTVIGETVNLVARMEAFSLRGQVLISEAAHARAAAWIEVGQANLVQPKGAARPLTLYPLRAVEHRGQLTVPAVEPRRSPRVRVQLEAVFRRVQAKRVDIERFTGRVRDIGYNGLSAELPIALPSLTELAIRLPMMSVGPFCGDLYARVLRAAPEAVGYRTSLAFTSVDTPAHRQVKALVDEGLWRR
ncbi:MAG: PilZ domain-containing protein [Thiohalocapsa sp.]|jgi:adenylate cyclase|uniref:adenylate/guanylate cyclase domain-containing protein n=1 Tax=Thiohalocapsa sp. TaxID=2497641 RepID=UPI0025F71952|nr:adenylate/guanylate cyclase domain-containing protein [Thiohalocapsa sp.]MCG6940661.1 PilZ domain-containing protein [Thiohalocapsa sp.]